jgi:hypothetical protein
MSELLHKRCFNHAMREAAARCPSCGRYFCRECVTEHDNRVLCAACLRKPSHTPLLKRSAFTGLIRAAQIACGVLLAWFFFFLIGQALTLLPDSFHDASLWKIPWIDAK